MPAFLFLVTFAIRFQYCIFMNPIRKQTSDFARTLYYAIHGHFETPAVDFYQFFTHKFYHGFFLYYFGFRSQLRVYFLQCVYVGFIAVLIYFIGKRIRDERLGLLAATLYVLWPTQTLYQSQTSEEHPSALIAAALIFLLIDMAQRLETLDAAENFWEQVQKNKRLLGRFVCIGILCGLSPLFKDWAAIILTAALLCSVYLLFHFHKHQRIWLAIGFFLIFALRTGVHSYFTQMAEREFDAKVGGAIVVAQMYETMDPEFSTGDLKHDMPLMNEYRQMVRDYGYDFSAANREALAILGQKISANMDKVPNLLFRKGVAANSSTNAVILWSFQGMDSDTRTAFQPLITLLSNLDQTYYICVILCILLCAVLCRNRYLYFILLIIVGGITAQLLIENGPRYKYSIEFAWCLAAAGGLYPLFFSDWTNFRQGLSKQWAKLRKKPDVSANQTET